MEITAEHAWWIWHHSPGLTHRHWLRWLEAGITPLESLHWSAQKSQSFRVPAKAYAYWQKKGFAPAVDHMERWLKISEQHHIVHYHSEYYPPLLRQIPDPPMLLYVMGQPATLRMQQCAVVGSRKPTGPGIQTAQKISQLLVSHHWCVTSGLAIGIDGYAHQAALAVQGQNSQTTFATHTSAVQHQWSHTIPCHVNAESPTRKLSDAMMPGQTIAVLGCGIDIMYPKQHRSLARKIASNGAVISELPLGTPIAPWQFPKRNRLIAGLSVGTVVVEAAKKSGSLITGRLCLEQNRELMVVPSSMFNPQAQGCLQLLQEGAYCLSAPEDVLHILNDSPQTIFSVNNSVVLSQYEQAFLQALGYEDQSIDQVADQLGWQVSKINQIVTALEMKNKIIRTPRGIICC